jgi:RNA polymerase sigma-70 factor (ECF subfamily)
MSQLLHKQKTSAAPQLTAHRKHVGFEDLLTAHMEALWQVALRLTNYHRDDAKDLIQDAALRAFNHRETLAGVDNPFGWLKKVLVNTFLNRVRDDKRWNEVRDLDEAESVASDNYEGTPSAVLDVLRTDIWNDDLMRALDSLPELSRQLFILSDIEGYTHDELAVMFSLPKGTVSSRIYRARTKLAQKLEAYAIRYGFITSEQTETERAEMRQAMAMCPDRAKMEEDALRILNASPSDSTVQKEIKR